MLSVIITSPAQADLQAIADYIGDYSPDRAVSFVDELHRFCMGMGSFPHMGRSCEDMKMPALRRFPFDNYTIFYRVTPDRIEVLRVLHGAMDAKAQFDL